MTQKILSTKFYVPAPQTNTVRRPLLLERLNEGLHRKLTLISAPAGFGKTTLASEWVAACDRPAAWLSLDEGDSDLVRFLTYLVGALQTVAPSIGTGVIAALQSPQPPPVEAVLTALINDITTHPDHITLILDDYHAVDSRPVDDALTFLLDHLPPHLHLTIASRSDPPVPLARLRGRGELTELRVSDLRFTADEAAAFLNQVMGLNLSTDDIAALESRTEGWIAGLQLAALSMQGRDDVSGFIQAFAGDHRYIVDYLVEEVLHRHPERVRSFLLQTSILERLSGPLCDAVTSEVGGQARLEALERANLFVIPLDDQRHWYRYHHLFADVLQVRAMEEQPEQLPIWHRRASAWYEDNRQPSEAVRHALLAEDFERAADLVERAARAMLTGRHDEILHDWLKALPDEVVRTRPVLSVYNALAVVGLEPDNAEARLQDAERLLDMTAEASERPGAEPVNFVVADEEGYRSLSGTIAIVRAYRAGARGDLSSTAHYARQALDLLPEDDDLWRGAAGGLLGLVHWTGGNLEAAYQSFKEGWDRLRKTEDITQSINGAFVLADIRTAQGRLREAARIYKQALEHAANHGQRLAPPMADLYVGLSELSRERNDLEAAARHLQKAKELGEHAGITEHRHRWYIAMARIAEAQGQRDRALELLDEADRRYIRSPAPNAQPIEAIKARVWNRQDRLSEAIAWVRERGLSIDDELSYLHEFEHITLVRVLLAHYMSTRAADTIRDTMTFLERLQQAAEDGGRIGSQIELLTLQALAHAAQGDISRALVPLERALTMAEPEGYVRLFIDEGQAIRTLLRHAGAGGIANSYTQRLLTAFDEPAWPASTTAHAVTSVLAEPLTGREVEILRLIATGMRNQEIADHLFISLSTVKRHIANAYRKLGVSNRTEAVARAKELNLL